MKNGNEGRDVSGGSRKRYRARGQRWENKDRAKNRSDCGIRYCNLWEKNDVYGPVHTRLKIFKSVTLSMHILKNIRVHNYHWGNLHVI